MKRITLLLLSFFWAWGAMASVKDVKITYKVEVDGWTQGKQLSTVLSSYSAMCLQQDGNIAFFFEEAPWQVFGYPVIIPIYRITNYLKNIL